MTPTQGSINPNTVCMSPDSTVSSPSSSSRHSVEAPVPLTRLAIRLNAASVTLR